MARKPFRGSKINIKEMWTSGRVVLARYTSKSCLKSRSLTTPLSPPKSKQSCQRGTHFDLCAPTTMSVGSSRCLKFWQKSVSTPKPSGSVRKSNIYDEKKRLFIYYFLLTEQFNYLKKHNHEYFTIAICDDTQDKIVAAGTIFIERKFVHHNGLVGHIEDIAVDSNQQGKKLGLRIIQALKYIGAKAGCYKVILDCSAKVISAHTSFANLNGPKTNRLQWFIEYTILRKVWIHSKGIRDGMVCANHCKTQTVK